LKATLDVMTYEMVKASSKPILLVALNMSPAVICYVCDLILAYLPIIQCKGGNLYPT